MSSQHLLRSRGLVWSDGRRARPNEDLAGEILLEGEDWTTGEPEPIERTIETALMDGAIVVTDGKSNRQFAFNVTLRAATSDQLALLEAAMVAELGRPNELFWTPPDGWGATSVFEVVTSKLTHVLDDLAEVQRGERSYRVVWTCLPYVRGDVEIVTVAADLPTDEGEPVEPVEVVLSDTTTTANWESASTLTDVGSALMATGPASPEVIWVPASPVDLSEKLLVSLHQSWQLPVSWPDPVERNRVRSLSSSPLLSVGAVVNRAPIHVDGFRYAWQLSPAEAAAVGSLKFSASLGGAGARLTFDDLIATNVPPSSGTLRQKLLTLGVAGSVRTQGSIEVSHATSPLGMVAVYTWPGDLTTYAPSLRRHWVSGNNTPDAATVSGSRDNLSEPAVFEAQITALPPGAYVVVAVAKCGAINLSAQAVIGGDEVGPEQTLSGEGEPGVSRWVTLGRIQLPSVDTPANSSGVIRFTATGTAGDQLDEVFLLNTTIGSLTVADCSSAKRLWIASPTIDTPRPVVRCGNAEDGSDSYSVGGNALAIEPRGHELPAPGVNALIVTGTALDATTALRYHPRFDTHAYKVPAS